MKKNNVRSNALLPDSQFVTGASSMAVPRGPPWRSHWEEGRVWGGFSVPLEMC